MKKILGIIILFAIVFALLQFNVHKKEDNYLVKINNYTITLAEFNEEFNDSAYAKDGNLESKKDFLSMLIKRKLVLQDAQSSGLDKDKEFLKSIERFWEQSLLKLAMDNKAKEISGTITVLDKDIEAVYNRLKKDGKIDKPYDQMYSKLKWSLTKIQETQAINKWLDSLYKNADIKINPKYIPKKSENNSEVISQIKEVKDITAVKVNKGKK